MDSIDDSYPRRRKGSDLNDHDIQMHSHSRRSQIDFKQSGAATNAGNWLSENELRAMPDSPRRARRLSQNRDVDNRPTSGIHMSPLLEATHPQGSAPPPMLLLDGQRPLKIPTSPPPDVVESPVSASIPLPDMESAVDSKAMAHRETSLATPAVESAPDPADGRISSKANDQGVTAEKEVAKRSASVRRVNPNTNVGDEKTKKGFMSLARSLTRKKGKK